MRRSSSLARWTMHEGVAEACTGLALVTRTRGDYAEAETLFREALAIYESLGDEGGDGADARPVRRCASSSAGEMDRARPHVRAEPRALPAARGLARSRLGLYGLVVRRELSAPMPEPARTHVESLDILRALGDRRTYGKVLVERWRTSQPTSVMPTRRRRSSRSR